MIEKIRNIDQKQAIRIVWLLFFGSVIGRFLIGNSTKNLFVYSDELNYVSLAKSLIEGRGVSIYNGDTNYHKVFYSLCLAPAFLFKNPHIISRIVQAINCVLMSLGVFPVYHLSKKMLKKPVTHVLMSVLYFMGADMVFTMTFMSEALFVPLALLLLCLYYDYAINIDLSDSMKKHVLMNLISGVAATILYYVKEVGLVFLAGFFAVVILTNAYCFLMTRDSIDIGEQKQILLRQIIALVIQVIVFLIVRYVMEDVLFGGEQSTYQLYGLGILTDSDHLTYFIRSVIYYITSMVLAFGGISVLLPLLKFDKLERPVKRLFLFVILLVLGTALIVAFMISLREDYPVEINRTHTRYLGYLYLPCVLIFAHLLENDSDRIGRKRMVLDVVVLLGFTYIMHLLHWSAWDISGVDDNLLNYLEVNNETLERISHISLFVAVFFLVTYVIYHFRRDKLLAVFVAFLLIVSVANNCLGVYEYGRYKLPDDVLASVEMVSEFESSHPDKTFLILNGRQDRFVRARDTYDRNTNNYVLSAGNAYLIQQDGGEIPFDNLENMGLYYPLVPYSYDDMGKIDYVITSWDYGLDMEETEECLNLYEGQYYFRIYDVSECDVMPPLVQAY